MTFSLLGCAGKKPEGLGVAGGRLAPCPSSPNCVSSESKLPKHAVEPFQLAGDPGKAWKKLREVVASLPRTKIVTASNTYIHAECSSLLMRFVDDLELYHDSGSPLVQVRSASRLGYSDMGVNRKRVENLRRKLIEQGIVAKGGEAP